MRVEGLPREVAALPDEWVLPEHVNHGNQAFGGPILEVEGRLLAPMYLRFADHAGITPFYCTVVFTSEDEGRSWQDLSTVVGPDAVPGAPQGPCEAAIVQLASGELMCVMRVGWEGKGWPMVRSYSADGGRNWSPPDRVPGWSVAPDLLRLTNGMLLLCAGRPGSYLWLSTDPRGETWQRIDLLEHHNRWAPDPGHTIFSQDVLDMEKLKAKEQRHRICPWSRWSRTGYSWRTTASHSAGTQCPATPTSGAESTSCPSPSRAPEGCVLDCGSVPDFARGELCPRSVSPGELSLAQIHRRDDYAAAERAIGAREGDGPGTIWGRGGPVLSSVAAGRLCDRLRMLVRAR